jgi:sugar phosphate isomerase/epimerase
MNRRTFLTVGGAAAAPRNAFETGAQRPTLCLFSKHLEWIRDYSRLADTVASIGFEGVDLTVRENGHVDPKRVEEDLPKACEAIRKAGLQVAMITTRIEDARKPETHAILKTSAALGIRYYRRGGESWGQGADPLRRIAELHPKIRDLVELNKQYGMFAGIHNHSGYGLGAAIWDLYELVKPFDARYIGSNYDIGHATAEGGYGAWRSGFHLLASARRIGMVAVKDFVWRKREDGWRPSFCPLGEGMVDMKTFLGYLKQIAFAGPVSLHFEYSSGSGAPEEKRKAQLADMRRDLNRLRAMASDAGLL